MNLFGSSGQAATYCTTIQTTQR